MTTVEKIRNPEFLAHHPVLLLGGEGLVGSGLGRGLADVLGESVVLCASRTSAEHKVDVTDYHSVHRLIREVQPGLILHLAALANVDECEQHPDMAFEVNVGGMRNVLEEAKGVPVVYFSTDYVFDGECQRPYGETDMPNPISVYGQSKLAAEMLFLDSGNPGFISRISFPWQPIGFHLAHPVQNDTLWWIASSLLAGQDVACYNNVVGSWTPLNELSSQFWGLTQKMLGQKRKLVHLAGGETRSVFDVAGQVRGRLEREPALAPKLGRVLEIAYEPLEHQRAPRPQGGGLDTQLATRLGVHFTPIEAAINSDWFDVALHSLL